jgi:hypothetical protein
VVRDFRDLGGEPITPPGNCHYVPVLTASLAKRAPDHGHLLCKIRFFHNRIRPESPHQLVFAEEPPAVGDENVQQVIRLRRESDRLAVTRKYVLSGVQQKRPELI